MPKNTSGKGFVAEEALRSYFRNSGYFVVQGIPLYYKNYDVTDIDLWLYVKTTTFTAERTCVDVKRKRTPQAMERVLWTKGLQEILGLDRAIVVTSDNRPETRDFGLAHGIGILQGDFLHRVIASFPQSARYTDEEFFSMIKTPCVVNSNVEWRNWYRRLKTKLIDSLNFDGCNRYILAIKLLMDEYLATNKSSEVPIRLLYILISYFLISLDYTARSFVHLDTSARFALLTNGFRYGEVGQQRTEEIVQMALRLLEDVGKTNIFPSNTLRGEFDRQAKEYHSEILGEHFAKPESLKNMFTTARAFEELGYSKKYLLPHELTSDQKAIIGLFCDLLDFDRKDVI